LNACAASKRTSLQGLDNTAADGTEGFKTLEDISNDLHLDGVLEKMQLDKISEKLNADKRYLKTDYKLHVSVTERCADHCIMWLLSENTSVEFQSLCDHVHNISCDRCDLIKDIENAIINLTEGKRDLKDGEDRERGISKAVEQIHAWQSHIVRTINQDQSRLDLLQNIDRHQVIIVMDWAMKFLPRKVQYCKRVNDLF
jgi:hypothetical protein